MKHLKQTPIHTSLAKGGWGDFLLTTFVIVMIFQSINGFALATEPIHRHSPALQMRSQHNAMSIINKQWRACKKSLAVGDFKGAGASLSRIQKAADNLAKFRPHKNAEKMADFREQSDNFMKNLSALGTAIKENDKAQAQSLSSTIDNSCKQCHRLFR